MLEQVSTSVKFLAFFTASKQGKTGLTVTVDIYNPSGTQIVTAGSATALGGGLYSYTLSTDNSSEGEYAAIFKTTDSTVDAQHIPSLWVLGRAGVENLDAATSSRLPSSSYTAPANSDISAIKSKTDNLPSDPADQSLVESALSALSIPTVVQIRQEMDSNSTKLANLDTTVSSRLAPSGTLATVTTLTNAPTVPSATDIATQVRTELATELARVDAAVSTRLASASYTAPANSDIAAIKAKTDNLPASPAAVSDIPSANISAIKAKTDNLPASPAATGDIPSANISAIKAKTDLLNTDRLAQVSTVSTTGAQLAAALS
jgi:hypothetical protein